MSLHIMEVFELHPHKPTNALKYKNKPNKAVYKTEKCEVLQYNLMIAYFIQHMSKLKLNAPQWCQINNEEIQVTSTSDPMRHQSNVISRATSNCGCRCITVRRKKKWHLAKLKYLFYTDRTQTPRR